MTPPVPSSTLKSSWHREAMEARETQQLLPCPGDTQLDTLMREFPFHPAAIPAPSPQFDTETLPSGSRMPGKLFHTSLGREGAFLGNKIVAVSPAFPQVAQLYPRETNILFLPQGFSHQPFTNSSDTSRAGWSLNTNPYPSQLIPGATDFTAPRAFSSQITPGMQELRGITAPLLPHTQASCGTIAQTYYIEILILKLKRRRSLEKVRGFTRTMTNISCITLLRGAQNIST